MGATSVFLNVHDLEKSRTFYEALGWKVTREGRRDDGTLWNVYLDRDGAVVGLGAIETSKDPRFHEWVSTPLGAGVVVFLRVDAPVDDLYAKAKAMDAVIESEPADLWFGRAFMLNDPDGYTLTLWNE